MSVVQEDGGQRLRCLQEPLLRQLNSPLLFVNGELDEHCRTHAIREACSSGRLHSASSTQIVTLPVRLVHPSAQHLVPTINRVLRVLRLFLPCVQGLSASLTSAQQPNISRETCEQVGAAVVQFVSALQRDALQTSTALLSQPQSVPQPLAATAAEQPNAEPVKTSPNLAQPNVHAHPDNVLPILAGGTMP